MMEEHRDVHISLAVETLELRLDPLELDRVRGNVGVERDKERVRVAERVRRIVREAVRRSVRGNQTRVGCEIILQAGDALGIRRLNIAADVVVTDRQEIGNSSLLCQPVDEGDVADAQLSRDAAILDGITAL